jgi:hypothetical protein
MASITVFQGKCNRPTPVAATIDSKDAKVKAKSPSAKTFLDAAN